MSIKIEEGLSFDDVLLKPNYSNVVPKDVSTKTRLTRNIELNIPIASAAMDTVTESQTAIALAREGGIGFIHRNMSIITQALEVKKVKKSESGMIVDPITIRPKQTVLDARSIMKKNKISGLPVTDRSGKLLGIVTNTDLRFIDDDNTLIEDTMTKKNELVTVNQSVSISELKKILGKNKIEKLPVIDKRDGKLKGLFTIRDIENKQRYPNSCKDSKGRLRVGAAVGVGEDMLERVDALVRASVDVIVIDTSHGHTKNVVDAVKIIRKNYGEKVDIIAGNVATEDGALALAQAGVDAIKVGIGPGSICTTRIVSGIGVPQLTAIMECVKGIKYNNDKYVPVIADGGIKHSGDITKALAAGADCVMIGGMLAGTRETPGEEVIFQGRTFKVYRGMGSVDAMKKGSKDRYYQSDVESDDKLVPEGIEGRVPFKGYLADIVYQMVGGLKSGMGYLGCKTIEEMKKKAEFIKITQSGMRESHVHDVIITKEAPNYSVWYCYIFYWILNYLIGNETLIRRTQ